MIAALTNLEATGKVLLIDEQITETTNRAARNLPGVRHEAGVDSQHP